MKTDFLTGDYHPDNWVHVDKESGRWCVSTGTPLGYTYVFLFFDEEEEARRVAHGLVELIRMAQSVALDGAYTEACQAVQSVSDKLQAAAITAQQQDLCDLCNAEGASVSKSGGA